MNRTITPVFRNRIESLCEKFFRPEFIAQELGRPGRWLVSQKGQGFSGPVKEERFKENLALPQLPAAVRAPTQPVGWHIELHAGVVATTLWALGDKELRLGIERFHEKATYTALAYLGYQLSNVGLWQKRKLESYVFANFVSGVTEQKSADLHSDAFLMNLSWDPHKGPTAFSAAKVRNEDRWIKELYEICMHDALSSALGHFDKLARQMMNSNSFHISNIRHVERLTSMLGRGPEAIFDAWKVEAAAQGFGPEKVEAVLRSAAENRVAIDPSQRRSFLQIARAFIASNLGRSREKGHEQSL